MAKETVRWMRSYVGQESTLVDIDIPDDLQSWDKPNFISAHLNSLQAEGKHLDLEWNDDETDTTDYWWGPYLTH